MTVTGNMITIANDGPDIASTNYWSQREAAAALGVTLPTYQEWRRGARFRDGMPIEIDRRTALACAALAAGLSDWQPAI